jgi:hypothetical protein
VAAFTVRKQINELGADKAGTSMPQASQVQLLLCRVTADELRRVMVCRSAARGEAKEPVGRPVEHARVFVLTKGFKQLKRIQKLLVVRVSKVLCVVFIPFHRGASVSLLVVIRIVRARHARLPRVGVHRDNGGLPRVGL